MAEIAVCKAAELPPGSVAAAEFEDGARACVANVHGEVFAVADKCPHLFAPLSAGDLNGAHIVCPWHDSEFDMRTGRTRKWLPTGVWNILEKTMPPLPGFLERKLKPDRIATYRARVADGTVYISND